MSTRTVPRTCHICEANCGLLIDVEGEKVVGVRPDHDDVYSQGYICPKGAALGELHHDPDRLKQPVRRNGSGGFDPISWDEAFSLVADSLLKIQKQHGPDAIALYIGNPVIHNTGALALRSGLIKAVGSKNVSSASSQDTAPRFAASYYLYGLSIGTPVPDIDRTDYLLCIGANPRVSNGSVLTAPNMRGRLKAILDRGGRVVVIDPRRTETADTASEHLAIIPGGDAAFLLSLVHIIVNEGWANRTAIEKQTSGWQEIERRLKLFPPEKVQHHVGIDAETIRRIAREFAHAPTSVAYSRIGVCNNRYGTIASYATDLLNIVCGRLGQVGGSLFPRPVVDGASILKWTEGDGHARWRTRVRQLPETLGDVPASTLAEEMETPGTGQVRALFTYAGNPVLSTPNGKRLARAIAKLDFMVSIDRYINETTRHAHVILPPASHLAEDFIDIFSSRYALRTIARWSPPVFEPGRDDRTDWQILLEIIYRLGGGPTGISAVDWLYRWARRIGFHWQPSGTVDLLMRLGPHGDRFLPWKKGLSLAKVKAAPGGVDLGPLPEGLEHAVHHADKRVHLDVPVIMNAIDRLAEDADSPVDPQSLLLIGRRELRSNNSWLHNIPSLVAGKPRCELLVHPEDAHRLGLEDGSEALLENSVHRGVVPVRFSDKMRPGVVSLPHGWGHAESAPWQRVAGERPGVSFNDWTDDAVVEEVVGQSILNGIPVRLAPVPDRVRDEAATGNLQTIPS